MTKEEMRIGTVAMTVPRIMSLIGFRDIGNGSGLAEATATVIAHDIIASGATKPPAAQTMFALMSDDDIREVAAIVMDLVPRRASEQRTLPSGSTIDASHRAGVRMGDKGRVMYVPCDQAAGLHPVRGLKNLGRGPNDDRLRETIARHMAKLPHMDIPRVTAEDIVIRERGGNVDVVEVPVRSGPGTTCMNQTVCNSVSTMVQSDMEKMAADYRRLASSLWRIRDRMDGVHLDLTTEIAATSARIAKEDLPLVLLGVQGADSLINAAAEKDDPTAIIHFNTVFAVLGNDLKPAAWRPRIAKDFDKTLRNMMGTQRKRKRLLEESAGKGIRGRIDAVTLRAIEASTSDTDEVLRRIGGEKRLTLDMGRNGKRPDPLRLSWRDGMVHSTFGIAKNVTWDHGTVVVKWTEFPDAVLGQLPGRTIATVIDSDLMDPDDRIRSVTGRNGGYLKINLDVKSREFDSETGRLAA